MLKLLKWLIFGGCEHTDAVIKEGICERTCVGRVYKTGTFYINRCTKCGRLKNKQFY